MNFKLCRNRSGMTQEEVAAALGIPKKTYQNYEREVREPDSEVLCALADLYGITIDELVGRVAVPTDNPSALVAEAVSQQDELVGIFQSLTAEGRALLLSIARDVEEHMERP